MLLLTGQRLETVRGMRWSDIDADGVWTVNVADADRQKGTIERVRLSPLALDTLAALPRIEGSDYVFPGVTGALVDADRQQGAAAQGDGGGDGRRARRGDGAVDPTRSAALIPDPPRRALQGRSAHGGTDHRPPHRGRRWHLRPRAYVEQKSDALQAFATHLLSVVGENVVQFRPVTAEQRQR